MMRCPRSKRFVVIFGVLFAASVFLCACGKRAADDKVVAIVNGESIFAKDLKREIALRVRQNPSYEVSDFFLKEILESLIDKKLLVQQAMKEKISRQPEFADAIKAFWEQTLIKYFVQDKTKQLGDYSYITDGEVEAYYDKLKVKATFNVIKRDEKASLEAIVLNMKNGENVKWEDTLTLSYGDLTSDALAQGFDLDIGQTLILRDQNNVYYLIQMVKKEEVSMPPLADAAADIKAIIRQRKQQQAFGDWLAGQRQRSVIKIDDKALRGVR